MERTEIQDLVDEILADHGVPRRVKDTLEQSLVVLNGSQMREEKIAHLISVLDDASTNPNLSMNARTSIWTMVSTLEREMSRR